MAFAEKFLLFNIRKYFLCCDSFVYDECSESDDDDKNGMGGVLDFRKGEYKLFFCCITGAF